MDRKKVIIIGSGLGGLSSGVVLAKNGYRVTVLEQDALPGGCLQCFCRRGVKFETGMHFIGSADEGQILNKMMRYLEIDGQVELARLDTDRYNVVSLQGEEFEFANGREAFIERMASRFPGQTDNLVRYCRLVESISAASSLHTLKYGQTDGAVTAEYQLRSVNEVVEEIITDPLLQKVLVGDLPLYAAVRDKTPFSVHAFIMDFYNRSAFRFVGGSDVLVRALTDVLTGHGGEVRTRSRVTRIVCDATHAIGVEVNGGEFLPADYVISAAHPMRTMEMLGEVKGEVSAEDYMRAEYVIEEIQRVLDVCEALEKGDYETVGQKMYGTHYGMSKLYEVSCEELDFLNDIAKECGVTGSRVMGGGFGGCTINLVKNELYDAFVKKAFADYTAKFGHEPKLYDVIISDGARKLH